MIEPIMYFAIGFLVASLIGLMFVTRVHERAVRLTVRRIEAATPLSMAEIQADRDQLRAEFALSTRRLEMSVEQMKTKTTSQLAELSKKSAAIAKLKHELGEKSTAIRSMETREITVKDQLRTTEEEFSERLNTLREAERTLADKEAELAKLAAALDERTVSSDSQRIEMIALNTQIEALKNRVNDSEHELNDTAHRLARVRGDAKTAADELAAERARAATLDSRVVALENQLVAQTTEADQLGKRAQELELRLIEQGRLLAQREHQNEELNAELANVRRIAADLRAELTNQTGRQNATAERAENAVLRERINDIAAEIARLTATVEGRHSPIDQMLAEHAAQMPAAANRVPAAPNKAGPAPSLVPPARTGGTLVDRIRALRSQTVRVPTAN